MVLPHFVGVITQLQFNFFVSLPSEVTQVPNFISDLCTLTPAVSPRITPRL